MSGDIYLMTYSVLEAFPGSTWHSAQASRSTRRKWILQGSWSQRASHSTRLRIPKLNRGLSVQIHPQTKSSRGHSVHMSGISSVVITRCFEFPHPAPQDFWVPRERKGWNRWILINVIPPFHLFLVLFLYNQCLRQ